MDRLEALLARFEAGLLPHERFAVQQGLVAPHWRFDDELPPGLIPCAYVNEAVQRLRERAHSDLGSHLIRAKDSKAGRMVGVDLPYGIYAPLLDWALVDLRLNTVSSFASFALLLRAVAGEKALVLAASLYAAACLHVTHSKPERMGPEALADMAALHEALAQKHALQLAA